MNTTYLRFWIEHNTADMEPVRAVLPWNCDHCGGGWAELFPIGGDDEQA